MFSTNFLFNIFIKYSYDQKFGINRQQIKFWYMNILIFFTLYNHRIKKLYLV